MSPLNSSVSEKEKGGEISNVAADLIEIPHINGCTAASRSLESLTLEETDEEVCGSLPTESAKGEIGEQYSLRPNTHDTSFVEDHVPNIAKFAQDLQTALNGVWPTRNQGRYASVHVLLISWEDDSLGVFSEMRRLGDVFSHLYRFDVEEFRIPRRIPGRATASRISSFLGNEGRDNLFIVYYAGHARLSKQTNEPAIWTATDAVDSPSLPSGGVQQLLEESESDVLLLYDSCHSSHPAVNVSGQGVTEVIAACGFETQAPAVGPHSFTNALVRELEEGFADPPISIAELHGRILGSLKSWKPGLLRNAQGQIWTNENGRPKYECHKRRTPVHCFLTNETPYRSIMLAPLPPTEPTSLFSGTEQIDQGTSTKSSSETMAYSAGEPDMGIPTASSPSSILLKPPKELHVLLAVRLEDDYFLDGPEEDIHKKLHTWCEWLRNIPEGTKSVSIEGVYKSCSTLVLLKLPVAVWNLLPEDRAYSFVGFVDSDNLAPKSAPKTTEFESRLTTDQDPQDTFYAGTSNCTSTKAFTFSRDFVPEAQPWGLTLGDSVAILNLFRRHC